MIESAITYWAREDLLEGAVLDQPNLYRLGLAFRGHPDNLPDGIVDFDRQEKTLTGIKLIKPGTPVLESLFEARVTAFSMGIIFNALLSGGRGAEVIGYEEKFFCSKLIKPGQLLVVEAKNPVTGGNLFCCDIHVHNLPYRYDPETRHTSYEIKERQKLFAFEKALYTMKGVAS